MTHFIIRQATVFDIPALEKLVNSAFRGESSRLGWTTEADLLDGIRIDKDSLHDMIKTPDAVILNYYGEEQTLVACVFLKKQETNLYLGMLTVAPSQQNKGIGKMLMLAAESYALSHNCNIITMNVLNNREELTDWYVRQGFYFTGETKEFPNDKRFGIPKKELLFHIMQKDLVKKNGSVI
ncbi:MAG: GNAT family N-acetyltransferase [Chitinophagaceae bacterium]|nr:GNAT family N-acetyltransferase [Chitinophagaceae bacterium]